MSIEHSSERDQQTAANYGMANFNGDPEAAEDLGIAFSPEVFEAHKESGRIALARLGQAAVYGMTTEAARQKTHQANVATYHLQDGPLRHATEAQKITAEERTAELKSRIEPTRFSE